MYAQMQQQQQQQQEISFVQLNLITINHIKK